jgi:cytoskeletal protein CcmA (bactofilin family)
MKITSEEIMLKKLNKNFFDQEIEHPPHTFPNLDDRPRTPFTTDLMNAIDPSAYDTIEEKEEEVEFPETTIAEGIRITGTMSFQKLIRIDGSFEGELISTGKLIIGPKGHVKANIDLEEAFISGKLVGDITVRKRLVLRGRAEVHGTITAPLISVDEGVTIVGMLNIAQNNPMAATDAFDYDHYSTDH